MKKTLISIAIIAIAAVGCVAPNPDKTPGADPYVVSPELQKNADTARNIAKEASTIAAVIPPASPFAPYIPSGTEAVIGLIGAASIWLANKKNNDAKASDAAAVTHKNAAATMAAMIVSGANAQTNIAQALQVASKAGTVAAVSQHLEDAQKPI